MSKNPISFAAQVAAALMFSQVAWGADAEMHFVTQQFEPFSYEEGGKAAGPTVEAMQAICEAAKLKCRFEVLPWRRANADVLEGRADGLFPLLPDNERKKTLHLSEPLVKTAYSFFVPAASAWNFKSAADLKGMTIGVFGPSGTANTLQEVVGQSKDIKTEVELSNLNAFKKLAGGRYGDKATVFCNRDVGNALLKKENVTGIRIAGDLKSAYYAFGVAKTSKNAGQMAALSKAQAELLKSGRIKEILAKYGLEPVAGKK